MSSILYVGPSWAVRSFDTVEGSEDDFTNLIQELNLDVMNLAKSDYSNTQCLTAVKNHIKDNKDIRGIIWVYCEPILDVPHELKKTVIESDNFWSIREIVNQRILSQINNLNIPVGLIGGHSDIVNCDYSNITVIHPSWQKFLAENVGVSLKHGWGAEVAHRYAMYEIKDSSPSKPFVFEVSDTLKSWSEMEMLGVFRGVHPNKKGNILFAKEIANNIQSFINNL